MPEKIRCINCGWEGDSWQLKSDREILFGKLPEFTHCPRCGKTEFENRDDETQNYVKATRKGEKGWIILNMDDLLSTVLADVGDVFQIEVVEMMPEEVAKLPEFEGF